MKTPNDFAADHASFPVFEMFHSWQGEGVHAGRSAFFIRIAGCPIHCPWCDSAETWDASRAPRFDAETLAEKARAARPDFVVITGGEPAVHELSPLCDALHAAGLRVHLETSGAFPIRGEIDWVTLSPKMRRLPLDENFSRANEIKIIVPDPQELDFWTEKISRARLRDDAFVWLHPEWSQRENPRVLAAISECVCRRGFPFRAGWQLHKLFNVR